MSFRLSLSPLQLQPPPIHLPPDGAVVPAALSFLRCCGPFQVPDLLNQIVLLITELLILRSVGLEVAQEVHEFGLVLQQYVQHGLSLVGVCNKYLLKRRETWCELTIWNQSKRLLKNITFNKNECQLLHWWYMFYVHTLKTWKASNWMFRLLSLSMFIISFKFSARLMYFVMTVKLCLSRRSSPRSWKVVYN